MIYWLSGMTDLWFFILTLALGAVVTILATVFVSCLHGGEKEAGRAGFSFLLLAVVAGFVAFVAANRGALAMGSFFEGVAEGAAIALGVYIGSLGWGKMSPGVLGLMACAVLAVVLRVGWVIGLFVNNTNITMR